MKKIILIDDDEKLGRLLKDFLKQYQLELEVFHHPQEGIAAIQKNEFELLVLDIMLPDMDGMEVCRKIREFSSIPILFLSARGDVTDRIIGLELGADDYLPKPFEPRELVARIQAITRRKAPKAQPKNRFSFQNEELVLDTFKRQVFFQKKELNLTTIEFDTLVYLSKNSGKIINRDELSENIKGTEWDSLNRSLDILVSRVRQKLDDDPKNPNYIRTIWGEGYMFIGSRDKTL